MQSGRRGKIHLVLFVFFIALLSGLITIIVFSTGARCEMWIGVTIDLCIVNWVLVLAAIQGCFLHDVLFQGWVQLFLILHLHKLCVHEVVGQPQLWEWGRVGVAQADQAWEPDRKAKSLAFLGKDEDPGKVTEQDTNSVESEKPKDTKVPKKAKLNVSDKDSPYALIDQYFPERESYFYQNKNKFLSEYNDHGQGKKTDIGNSDPSEVRQIWKSTILVFYFLIFNFLILLHIPLIPRKYFFHL